MRMPKCRKVRKCKTRNRTLVTHPIADLPTAPESNERLLPNCAEQFHASNFYVT
jgi:hypothetical protein